MSDKPRTFFSGLEEMEDELRRGLIRLKDHGKRIMRLEAKLVRLEGYGSKHEDPDLYQPKKEATP